MKAVSRFVQSACLCAAACAALHAEEGRAIKVATPADAEAVYNERRVALVIGNWTYEVGPLRNPGNDAMDMAQVLEDRNFEVMLCTNATREGMERAIKAFGEALKSSGVGIFYYAGHGVQIDSVNYLIPVDAQLEEESDAKYKGVDAGMVVDVVRKARNRLNMIILDACRDNPFHRSSRSAAKGLAQMDAPTGTLIAYATGPGQTAAEGRSRNGLYTKYLLENIKKAGQRVEESFKSVRVAVVRESDGKQTPWESSSLVGDFYFTPSDHYAKGLEELRRKDDERREKERQEYEHLQRVIAAREEAERLEKERIEQERIRKEETQKAEEERRRLAAQGQSNAAHSEGGIKKVKKGASFIERMIKAIITPSGSVDDVSPPPP